MGSDIKLSEFKRRFRRYQVSFHAGGKHTIMKRTIDGVEYSYALPTISGRRVKDIYEKKARRRFKLMPKDGTTDEDFYS